MGDVARLVDGGDMDCGSGLLLLITRAMRRLEHGDLLGVRSAEPSVATDLPVWAELVGHEIAAQHVDSESGPWWFSVRKVVSAQQDTMFTLGNRTPVGQRLWVYTNFDCNLACGYCCAQSSPKAAARRVSPEVGREAFAEFRCAGRAGDPTSPAASRSCTRELGGLVEAAEGSHRTILTNAMIFGRGTRRQTLEAMDRSVVLQVSLDSATPDLHDAQRGAGSWSKAMKGIGEARALGFRVRVAATLYDEDPVTVGALHTRLDAEGIDPQDRIIRPVAAEGFAPTGIHVSIDSLEPEPTITADGAWWHPVAVTNPNMRIADDPLPLSEVFGVVRDTLAVQDAATRSGREVFRCA